MCELLTIAAIAAGTTAVAGAGVSAYGQLRAADYQSKVAAQNAKAATASAQLAEDRGNIAAGVARMKGAQEAAKAKTELAHSGGVDLSTGTPLDVISDVAMLHELDAQTIKNNAAREAWGYKVGAVNAIADAELNSTRAKYGAAATLIGGAAQASSVLAGVLRPGGKPGTLTGVVAADGLAYG